MEADRYILYGCCKECTGSDVLEHFKTKFILAHVISPLWHVLGKMIWRFMSTW